MLMHYFVWSAIQQLHGLFQGGREGVEAEWEHTDEFHQLWKVKATDMLGRSAWRRKKLTKRV
jgi:DnaJ family protein C protein 8